MLIATSLAGRIEDVIPNLPDCGAHDAADAVCSAADQVDQAVDQAGVEHHAAEAWYAR